MTSKLLKIAEAEVGVRESGGNNSGRRIREYQTATNLKPASWPWCAAFVCYCIREWLNDPEVVAWLGLKSSTPESWRPKTALAYGFYAWSKSHPKTTLLFDETAQPEAGDIVMFDFSHVGFVVRKDGDFIETIEGNTNTKGTRDSVSGDGVFRKIRHKSIVRNFLRIRPSC
jgi:hypothetical protein